VAAFVLVHGSAQNASSWERVAEHLRARGHAVTAPDLPKKRPEWRLEDYAAEIARAAETARAAVTARTADGAAGPVMVAHSFSGVLLPLLARRVPCSRLVFLAAVIPEPRRSVRDQFLADNFMFSGGWIAAGPLWFDPSKREYLAREFLLHDCDEETVRAALPSIELWDTRHLATEPVPFDVWPDTPATSIVASLDRTLTPEWGRKTTRRVFGRDAIPIEAGHCPHVSRPDEVARILETLA
jgi:pimeloyl-ACP methyl ester carboxylesterase